MSFDTARTSVTLARLRAKARMKVRWPLRGCRREHRHGTQGACATLGR
jgi:hypothetical protein